MKVNDIETFRGLATDYLAGELSEKAKQDFLNLIDDNETFSNEFRLMEQVWKDAGNLNIPVKVPPMSDRLKKAISGQAYGGELDDDDLDMVSGGVTNEPEIDEDEI